MHDCGKRGLDGLGCTGGNRDFMCCVVMVPIKRGYLCGDLFAQRRYTCHRRVLVISRAHGFMHQVDKTRIAFEIRKSLAEVDRADFLCESGHGRENGGANLR